QVHDQSTHLTDLGFVVVSRIFGSMSTCRVGVSSRAISSSRTTNSFSVATMTNWLVRTSVTTLLRLSLSVLWTLEKMLLGLAYLSWMTRVISGAGAAGSLTAMREVWVFGSSTSWRAYALGNALRGWAALR